MRIREPSMDRQASAKGFVTLVSVLLLGAIGTTVVVSLLLLGLGSARTSFAKEQSRQAGALSDGCAEEALEQIRSSTPFTGSGSLTLGAGTCSYTVTSQGGQNRTITTSGTVGTIIRKVTITIDRINPTINRVSWQEVAD